MKGVKQFVTNSENNKRANLLHASPHRRCVCAALGLIQNQLHVLLLCNNRHLPSNSIVKARLHAAAINRLIQS